MKIFLPVMALLAAASAASTGFNGKKIIYLTFDDGPGKGTINILDTLDEYGVKGSFFINSNNIHTAPGGAEQILRAINNGHTIGDHSSNHMIKEDGKSAWRHASQTEEETLEQYDDVESDDQVLDPQIDAHYMAYTNPELDMLQFGELPVTTVTTKISQLTRDSAVLTKIKDQMMSHVRLPYTNHWRVDMAKTMKDDFITTLEHTCDQCTTPASSVLASIKLANMLFRRGASVYGWDLEWEVDAKNGAVKTSANTMVRFLNMHFRRGMTVRPNKAVILTHVYGFENSNAAKELGKFIEKCQQAGYEFHTIDKFSTDITM